MLKTEFDKTPPQTKKMMDIRERIKSLYEDAGRFFSEDAIIAQGKRSCKNMNVNHGNFCNDEYLVKDLGTICRIQLAHMSIAGIDPENFYDKSKREVVIIVKEDFDADVIEECRKLAE